MAGPFPQVRVCPTGGIGEANAATWLAEPNVARVGGTWIAPASLIADRDWARDKARLRTIVSATHTKDDLQYALDMFGTVGRELGVI